MNRHEYKRPDKAAKAWQIKAARAAKHGARQMALGDGTAAHSKFNKARQYKRHATKAEG